MRLAAEPYSTSRLDDKFVHLTNTSVQKKHPRYDELREWRIWSTEQLQEYVETQGIAPAGWVMGGLADQCKRIMGHTISSVQGHLRNIPGTFELFGFDFLVDDALQVHLLEVNSNPDLWPHNDVLKQLVPSMVEEALCIVHAIHEGKAVSSETVLEHFTPLSL